MMDEPPSPTGTASSAAVTLVTIEMMQTQIEDQQRQIDQIRQQRDHYEAERDGWKRLCEQAEGECRNWRRRCEEAEAQRDIAREQLRAEVAAAQARCDDWRRRCEQAEAQRTIVRGPETNSITVHRGMSFEGGVYHGQLMGGQPHGSGTLCTQIGRVIYSGDWQHGKRHGQGKAYYDIGYGPVLWFDGEWREGLAHIGTLFLDGDCYAAKKADGIPRCPITPIRWQAGQKIPNINLVPGGGWKLHQLLQDRGVSEYFPAGAL
mmetsp:Transcript_18172/g.51713  ORF Transcript_18172/g.51713 Transcript_18172/m.51713 type:complete len:262 (-) Transcript_18172:164-949(-)